MQITSAKYAESGAILATINGTETTVPDDMANRHRAALSAWEAEGNTIAPYEAPDPRDAFREIAFMAKHAFCVLMADLGVLTDDEAISAAKGDWPTSFDAAISDLGAREQRNARVLWAATTVVNRRDPLLERLRPHANLTPEQLDEAFGYVE